MSRLPKPNKYHGARTSSSCPRIRLLDFATMAASWFSFSMFSSCASAPTHDGGMFSNCASPPHDGARDDDDGDFAAPRRHELGGGAASSPNSAALVSPVRIT